jgi:hypothetical protein
VAGAPGIPAMICCRAPGCRGGRGGKPPPPPPPPAAPENSEARAAKLALSGADICPAGVVEAVCEEGTPGAGKPPAKGELLSLSWNMEAICSIARIDSGLELGNICSIVCKGGRKKN